MKFATWTFRVAGVVGLLVTIPLLFGESVMGVRQPEFYYGFVFLNICWQIAYVVVSLDPVRYRPVVLPAILAKGSGAATLIWLFLQGRISGQWVPAAATDAAFSILFIIAYWATRRMLPGQPA